MKTADDRLARASQIETDLESIHAPVPTPLSEARASGIF
jgi:hypothetical protein